MASRRWVGGDDGTLRVVFTRSVALAVTGFDGFALMLFAGAFRAFAS